ncbi:hypothetical protein ACFLR1_07265 [Bacteroidota bacterium]
MNFRNALLASFISLSAFVANAQVIGGANAKLEKLYAAEKYEDVAYKGMQMVDSDKHKTES